MPTIVEMNVDFSDEWIKHQLREINRGMPRVRVPLNLLLEMDKPSIETVGGDRHYFDKRELRELADIIPREFWSKLKLPIVFRRSLEADESLYFIDGGEVEVHVIKKLIGLEFVPSRDNQYYTYKPIISKLIQRFPSIIVIGFL